MQYHQRSLGLFLLITLTACSHNPGGQNSNESLSFATSDGSVLFFNNIRKIYYDLEEQENTKLRIYRIKTRPKNVDYPVINLALVHNWRYEEAYLIIEPAGTLEGQREIKIHWHDLKNQKTGIYTFTMASNKNAHLRFAGEIYESIMQKHEMHYAYQGESIPFLSNERDREAFRITVADYYRITGRL